MIGREVEIQKTDNEVINDNTGTIKDFSNGIVGKLSHKKWRRLWKKEKRKKKRQQMRIEFERLEEEQRIESGLTTEEAIEAHRKQEEWQELLLEKKRQKLHEDWLAVERNAQEEFERKKLEEERRRNERLEQERRIKEEWERQQREEEEGKKRKDQAAKKREVINVVLLLCSVRRLMHNGAGICLSYFPACFQCICSFTRKMPPQFSCLGIHNKKDDVSFCSF